MFSLYGLLDKAIKKGRLTVVDAKGFTREFGGVEPGPEAAIRFTSSSAALKILLNPELNAAEAYMDGHLVVDRGSIHDLIQVFYANKRHFDLSPSQIFWRGLSRRVRRFQQNNVLSRSRANVKAHYDIGEDLYRLFLDRDMQYSCAYFPDGPETIEDAQTLKKRHIAAKLCLKDGQRVLDIGCGWGGMALYLAHVADVEVVGVTLSERQLAVARRRAEILGVSDRVKFELIDYREVTEKFDRVVSVGMLEHVGAPYLPAYFLTVRDRLGPEGLALIHSISTKVPTGHHRAIPAQVYFPRWLFTVPVRNGCSHRANRAVVARLRDLALPLRLYACAVARTVSRKPGQGRRDHGRTLLPDVGALSLDCGMRVSARLQQCVPAADRA
jgi:cyclopropane-fatty-acyl-phospholipid synthase